MPPFINFNPIIPRDLDHERDPSLAELNAKLKEIVDAANTLAGHHGPITLYDHLDMNGNRVRNLGTPAVSTDALAQSSADPLYGAPVQQKAMEAVGTQMLQTTRRLNDGTQQHFISTDLVTQGSIPPTVVGGMTYTSTTTTITWSWTSLLIQYGDLTRKTIAVPNGSLVITGLASNTTYKFYPYWDTRLGQVIFITDTVGTAGAPPVAFLAANANAANNQNADGRVPLSIGGISGATTSAGTGGGGGGGSNCLWGGMVILTRTRGVVPAKYVHVGEVIKRRHGWCKVERKQMGRDRVFMDIGLSNGEVMRVTASDPIALFGGTQRPAATVCLSDMLVGVVNENEVPLQIMNLQPWQFPGDTVLFTVDHEEHDFLTGMCNPCVVAHNFLPNK